MQIILKFLIWSCIISVLIVHHQHQKGEADFQQVLYACLGTISIILIQISAYLEGIYLSFKKLSDKFENIEVRKEVIKNDEV